MTTVHIYLLRDPRTLEIRYVGQTKHNIVKYNSNRAKGLARGREEQRHLTRWLKVLAKLDLQPIAELIEETDELHWQEREIYWIDEYRRQGKDLVNTACGGLGGQRGRKQTPEEIEKRMSKVRGRKQNLSPEQREIKRQNSKKPWLSAEYRKNHTIKTKGRRNTLEAIERMRIGQSRRDPEEVKEHARLGGLAAATVIRAKPRCGFVWPIKKKCRTCIEHHCVRPRYPHRGSCRCICGAPLSRLLST